MVKMWCVCGGDVVNFNSRFVRLVVILGLVLVVNFNQFVAIFVVIFIVNFTHTKHYKYKVIFATFMKSWNQYLLVNSTIQALMRVYFCTFSKHNQKMSANSPHMEFFSSFVFQY